MTALRYVYAVCRPLTAPLQAELRGVAGAPARQLEHHGLIAVVSQVSDADFAEEPLKSRLEDLDWLTATARAHQNVIDALTGVTTPLPLRMATVFRDDSAVRVMIEEREDDFRRALDRLEGRVEWGVKIYIENPENAEKTENAGRAGNAERAESAGTGAGGGGGTAVKATSGRDYLRQRRMRTTAREEMWQKAEQFARRLHETLSAQAEDSRLHAPQNAALSGASGRNVLNAAYLVRRARSEEFVELVDRAKDDTPGIRVELTGPWAAYSFTGLTEEGQA